MNNRPTSTVISSAAQPSAESTVVPAPHASLVARRVAIIALMVLLVAPTLWSAVTGQRALRIDGASAAGTGVIAVVAPQDGLPQVGDTVAVHAQTASSVAVGLVADVTGGTIALHDAVRPDNWTASVADLRGTVLAVFDGPVIAFLAGLPPLTTSTAIILLIIALVAIPLRSTEPDGDGVAVHAPSGRHFRDFSDLSRS